MNKDVLVSTAHLYFYRYILDFDFYRKQFSAQKIIKKTDGKPDGSAEKIKWKSDETLETLRRNFIADMERNLLDHKNKWEQERIDAAPALNHALKLLNGNGWKNADILLISDFVMDSLPDEVANAIEAEKEKNTEFHSLVIGSSGNKAAVQYFNHNWVYDMNDAHAARHLSERLHELRK